MTEIERVRGPTPPRVANRAPAKSGFIMPTETNGIGQATAAPATEPASLASMLTLQELGGETLEDRKARRHGQDMLAALSALQRALLSDGSDLAALQQLAELTAAGPDATDRRLAAIVSAIIVRARVELARRQV